MRQHDAKSNMSYTHLVTSYVNMIKNDLRLFNIIRRRYRNFISVLAHIIRLKYPISATLTGGKNVIFENFESFYNDLLGLQSNPQEDVVYIGKYRFYGGIRNGDNIIGIFKNNDYNFLKVKDKIVIDIGGGIGDSAVYFIESGAKKVISLEPDITNFKFAKKNILINGIEKKVELFWAACSTEGSENERNDHRMNLAGIINSHDTDDLALKVDCEGCEYDIILSQKEDVLRKVSIIQIEYHYGYLNLVRKLESCGFKVTFTPPRYFKPRKIAASTINFHDNVVRYNNSFFVGWLYAERN
jgi:hypothetical protein